MQKTEELHYGSTRGIRGDNVKGYEFVYLYRKGGKVNEKYET